LSFGEGAEESALSDGVVNLNRPEPVEPEEPASDDASPEVVQVRKLCRGMAKAVKAAQLYPAENPMCLKFAEELMARITETLQIMDVVRLSVGKTKLFFAGETVLEQPGREDSVPGRLFWAGVREISFHAGLTGDEALTFLDLFRRGVQATESGEDDIVTLLWNAKFEHVTYIAIDDILDLTNESDPIPEEFGSEFMNYVDLDMHDLEDEQETERQASEMANQIRAKFNQKDVELFGVTEEERQEILAEIAAEESPKMLHDIVHIIGETLFLETEEAPFVELIQVLAGTLLALIGEGRLREAAGVLHLLYEVRAEGEGLTPAMTTAIDSGVAACFDPTRGEILVRHLDAGKRSTHEGLDDFVRALPVEAIEGLCNALGNLETPPARRRLTEALSLKANENIRPFLPFLGDSRPELVRAVARILAGTQNDRALEPLKGLLRHPDFHVRREALNALSQLGSARSLDVLSVAVYDPDPRIRIGAARALALAGRPSIPALLAVIEESDFDQRPLTEKRAFYEALGYAGGKEILPVIERALGRKALFKRTGVDEIRACACEALGWIGGDDAHRLLTDHLDDRSVLVRTAAQSGIRRILAGAPRDSFLKEAA
jgi:HEAT repeat protein